MIESVNLVELEKLQIIIEFFGAKKRKFYRIGRITRYK